MLRTLAVVKNTYLQTVRQPLYGLIVLVTLGAMSMAPAITGWTLDDDDKMLRDIGLSTLLIQGLFLSCFAATGVLSAEIEDKTLLTSAAKPVSRLTFILGKFGGVFLAITTAHYLAGIAFFMAFRHGVLQSASQEFDYPVLIFGPGLAFLLIIAAAVLNYIYDYRFLPTLLTLLLPFMTLSAAILLVVDKTWKLQAYEVTQAQDNLPPEVVDGEVFKNVIEFRPLKGEQQITGHRGHLVRKIWQGPISFEEQDYLLGLSQSLQWKKDIDFLAQEARKLQGLEIGKATILILIALGLLTSVALTASTRLGAISTFLACLMTLGVGLATDQILKPLAEGSAASAWARILYVVLPNFQVFWLVDALSDNRVIPWAYLGNAALYGGLFIGAILAFGAALFETREVG